MSMRIVLLAALAAMALPAMADDKIPITDEGKIGDQWSLVPGTQLMPPYPEAYASEPEQVCVVIGYLVNADGRTSDFSLLKSWTSGSNSRSRSEFWKEFADLASRALAQWKYAPSEAGSAKPVYTAATFIFGTRGAATATKEHCAIADLTTRLVELRYDARANRLMAGGIFSQLEIDPVMEMRLQRRLMMQRENAAQAGMASAIQEQRPVGEHPQLHDAD